MDNIFSKILIFGVILVVVVASIIFAISLFSSSMSKRNSAQEPTDTPLVALEQIATNEPITIAKIVGTPVVYKDLTVTVEGKIVGWVTKNAFIVNEVGEKNNYKSILVIRNQNFGLPLEVPAGDVALGETVNVTITGTAGIFNIKDGDTGYGDEDSVRELKKWNKKPVIFASSVSQK